MFSGASRSRDPVLLPSPAGEGLGGEVFASPARNLESRANHGPIRRSAHPRPRWFRRAQPRLPRCRAARRGRPRCRYVPGRRRRGGGGAVRARSAPAIKRMRRSACSLLTIFFERGLRNGIAGSPRAARSRSAASRSAERLAVQLREQFPHRRRVGCHGGAHLTERRDGAGIRQLPRRGPGGAASGEARSAHHAASSFGVASIRVGGRSMSHSKTVPSFWRVNARRPSGVRAHLALRCRGRRGDSGPPFPSPDPRRGVAFRRG